MRTITAILATVGVLATTGLAVGLDPAPVPVIVPMDYAVSYGRGDQCQYEGHAARRSAFAAGPCAAPPYGAEDTGRKCNHWRNSCCDDAWAGYCNETGLFGYRTTRDKCHCESRGGCGGCGGHLFSLFRWSQPRADCAVDNCQPEPEPTPSPATEVPTSPEA